MHIYSNELKHIAVALSPLAEQTVIARFLNETTTDIDTVIVRAKREIELLREYRTRLIADVVTGKLDVREAVAELPQPSSVVGSDGAETIQVETNS